MYSSNSSLNGNNLTFSSKSPFSNSFESNSTQNIHSPFPNPLPSFSFFQFPNYSDDIDPFQDTHQIFLQQHQHDVDFQLHHHHPPVVMNSTNIDRYQDQRPSNSIIKDDNNTINSLLPAADGKGKTVVDRQIQRKRSSKRDRHSKIKTAKGLRDRRMRLSLDVAKRFFGLQDMLGFEKASKTVDWLLNQSKVEIKHLIWNPFESVEESAGTHQEQHSDEDDDSLFIMSKWSPPMMFNSLGE